MNFLRFESNSYVVYDIQFNSLKHIELLMKTAYNKREHWEQEIVITMQSLKMVPTRVRVTSILKRAIYSGEYKSGQELSLTAIAEQLGISRTPVREAFQTLAAEGLITLRMSKGAIVNKIDQKFIKDTFEMRILLESTAAWKAAENGLPDADDYIAKLKDMEAHLDTIDDKAYEDLNQAIHMAIWEAADNQKLSNYLMELWNGPSTGHAIPEEQKHYRLSTEEHIQLLEYIRDHKPEEAKEAMARHIQRSEENVLAYLAKKEA